MVEVGVFWKNELNSFDPRQGSRFFLMVSEMDPRKSRQDQASAYIPEHVSTEELDKVT